MEFILNIRLDNESMQDGNDIAWALKKTADYIDMITRDGLPRRRSKIYDTNGNAVGNWYIKGDVDD